MIWYRIGEGWKSLRRETLKRFCPQAERRGYGMKKSLKIIVAMGKGCLNMTDKCSIRLHCSRSILGSLYTTGSTPRTMPSPRQAEKALVDELALLNTKAMR
jgi:hypothetical protein